MEKYVAPVPRVIFDYIVSFGLYPKVKADECDSTDPSTRYPELSIITA
jgi:hypothetical protein